MIGFRGTLVAMLFATPLAHAQTGSGDANAAAEFLSPVEITTSRDLDFGVVTTPHSSNCIYTIAPDGTQSATGDRMCGFVSGLAGSASFEVLCQPDTSVFIELVYSNSAPSGASFGPNVTPLSWDSSSAGPAAQIAPCDADGQSIANAGGELIVTPTAPPGFSGQVGLIRLEVAYE